MKVFTLFKYDPALYGEHRFEGDDWTDVSDIGKVFDGQTLTFDTYKEVEDRYLDFLNFGLDTADVKLMQVIRPNREMSLEVDEPEWIDDLELEGFQFAHDDWVGRDQILNFCRLALRGVIGFALSDRKGFFIRFIGDFYVHVGYSGGEGLRFSKFLGEGLYWELFGDFSRSNPLFEDYQELL